MEQSAFDRTKKIHYRLAEPGTMYDGHVMRIVTRDLGGVQAEVSATTTGKSLEEFKRDEPGEPIGGIRADSIASEVAKMTDEQLAAWGLERAEGNPGPLDPVTLHEPELKPTVTYPLHKGFGRWECSDGTVFTKEDGGKDVALGYELQLSEDADNEPEGYSKEPEGYEE